MDYSATIREADDPAGASPWAGASDSPLQQPPPGFTSLSDDPPSSLFSYTPPIANPLGQAADVRALQPPGSVATESGPEEDTDVSAPVGTSQSEPSTDSHPAAAASSATSSQPANAPDSLHAPAEKGKQASKTAQPQFRLHVKVTGLERTNKKDPVLRFDVHTNFPRFRTTQYKDVRRLHSEFVKLADHLISANPEVLVPAVPPSVTAAGAGTEEDETRMKAMMQRWFNCVCSSDILIRDDEIVLFVESDFGYSPVLKMKQPATGVRRKILKQFAPPPDDTPELADARPTVKLFYLGTMDASHKVDKLVKARRGLGLSESDFGVKLGSMNVQEPYPGLANAYRKLGKVIQTAGDYHAAQATAEAATFGDPLQYHSQDSFIVKESLTNRQILIREFLQAQESTRSKLNAADRLKASSSVRREKVDEAIAALEEARQTETALSNKTARVTQNLVQERRKWFSRTAEDLRTSIREFVLREIEAERRTLALLETVRPDIRSIDASGGLSRLGRESHPTVRRASLAASQGPKGDAWSGVPRRSDATTGRSASGSFLVKVSEERVGDDADEGSLDKSTLGLRAGVISGTDEDEDRIDARNAASRLATSTF